MKTFLKKNVRGGELELYKTLNSVAQECNPRFSILIIPHAVKIDEKKRTLTLPHYEGEQFDDKWDISNGGAPLKLDLAKEIPLVLKDLAQIETAPTVSNGNLSKITKLSFDHNAAIVYYGNLAKRFKALGLLTDHHISKIKKILRFRQHSRMIFNNGDFYPRNLIRLPNQKIALIDWETWNPHSPFYNVDHLENIAAVPYVHMWNNPRWRNAYVTALKKHFPFEAESFQKGIVIKALALSKIFDADQFNKKGRKLLIQHQMMFIKSALP